MRDSLEQTQYEKLVRVIEPERGIVTELMPESGYVRTYPLTKAQQENIEYARGLGLISSRGAMVELEDVPAVGYTL